MLTFIESLEPRVLLSAARGTGRERDHEPSGSGDRFPAHYGDDLGPRAWGAQGKGQAASNQAAWWWNFPKRMGPIQTPPTMQECDPPPDREARAASADFDVDGDVDGADFVIWQTHFPMSSGAVAAQGDADGDGDVDGADFVVWQTAFGQVEPPSWFDEHLQDAALISLGESYFSDGVLGRDDMLGLFQSAMDGGFIDNTEFADLTTIVSTSSLFGSLDYVRKLSSYVVQGNSANAKFQGQTLGNLVAGASSSHLENLVSKWYLGLDRPSASSNYALASGMLFVDGPSYTDVDQGIVNDCAFLASLAVTALRSPDTISNMFIVNGDGTFTVRFFRDGVAEYVTVDAHLPGGGGVYAGVPNGELWVALAEKAYAQAVEMTWFGGRQNSYASIEFLYAFVTLSHVTGQSTSTITYTPDAVGLAEFEAVYNSGESVCFISRTSPPLGGVVGSHVYAVINYEASSKTFTLFNPWGVQHGLLTLSWAEMITNFLYFDYTA